MPFGAGKEPFTYLRLTDGTDRSSGSDSEAADAESDMYELAHRGAKARHATFVARGNLWLAISTGFWVAVFGLPMYSVQCHDFFFGHRSSILMAVQQELNETVSSFSQDSYEQEELAQRVRQLGVTCATTDYGKMRDVSPGSDPHLEPWNRTDVWDGHNNFYDIWCGFFPATVLAWWPNVAQFIVFSVFLNTGTTINLAWQGFFGTLLASLNLHLLTLIFPEGGHGHKCMGGDEWIVLSYHRITGWYTMEAVTEAEANTLFMESDWRGLKGRVIFTPSGEIDRGKFWFAHDWKQKFLDKYTSLNREFCKKGAIVFDDALYAKYGNVVCIVDYLLVVFLLLISRANRNTMIWGLSWHVFYVMDFMNPHQGNQVNPQLIATYGEDFGNWFGSANFVVMMTTLLGCVFCIIATFVPCINLRNLVHLYNDARSLTNDITTVWSELLAYLCRQEQSAKRFQIERQIDELSDVAANVQSDLNGAWWETFNLGVGGRKITLLAAFDICVLDIRTILGVVKTGVLGEQFQGSHTSFMEKVKPSANELREATTDLMYKCLEACQDGGIEDEEREEISENVERVRAKVLAMRGAYQAAAPHIQEDLSEESTFIFALGFWSRKMVDLAESLMGTTEDAVKSQSLVASLREGILSTWSGAWSAHDHVMFCVRNFISIGICFFIGLFGGGSNGLFPPYSATMANTLSVLLLTDGGHSVDLNRNSQRILGVSLGKIVPMLCTTVLNFFPCMSPLRSVLQAAIIWMYIAIAMLIYFTSSRWNFIGCMVAGFGVYGLFETCATSSEHGFAMRYSEITQIIVAVFIQSFVHSALTKTPPRILVIRHLKETSDAVVAAHEAFFDGDLPTMQSEVRKGFQSIDLAKQVAPECDPSAALFHVSAETFKLELCQTSIRNFQAILGELNMIIAAVQVWRPNRAVLGEEGSDETPRCTEVLNILKRQCSLPEDNVREQLLSSARLVQELLPEALSETPTRISKSLRNPEAVKASMRLNSVENLYKRLSALDFPQDEGPGDLSMRLMIAVRSLQHSAGNFGSIEEAIIKATH